MSGHPTPSDGPSIVDAGRQQSMLAPISDVAGFLQDVLTVRLTAYICGVTEGKLVRQWASGEITDVPEDIEQRLRTAYEITLLLLHFDAPATVRAWFIGMSPVLDDRSAAEAIRAGEFPEAMGAARNFIAYG